MNTLILCNIVPQLIAAAIAGHHQGLRALRKMIEGCVENIFRVCNFKAMVLVRKKTGWQARIDN